MLVPISKGIENLLALASELERVHELYGEHNNALRGYHQGDVAHPCGTPACSWGHYLAMRYGSVRNAPGIDDGNTFAWTYQELLIGQEFDLTGEEVRGIFAADGCAEAETALEAATFIRAFIAQKITT